MISYPPRAWFDIEWWVTSCVNCLILSVSSSRCKIHNRSSHSYLQISNFAQEFLFPVRLLFIAKWVTGPLTFLDLVQNACLIMFMTSKNVPWWNGGRYYQNRAQNKLMKMMHKTITTISVIWKIILNSSCFELFVFMFSSVLQTHV